MLTVPTAELLHLVGYVTGATLYAMLFVLVSRAEARVDRLALATALLGLAWNVGELLLHAARGWGFPAAEPWLAAAAYTALGLLGAVVVHSVLRTLTVDRPARGAGAVIAAVVVYAGAGLAGALHLASAATTQVPPSQRGLEILTVALLLVAVPLLVATRRHHRQRWPMWAMALALFAVSALHLGRFHGNQESLISELVGHHASIPLAFAMLYRDHRFALADIFLKQALTLLALVALVFSLYTALEPTLARGGSPAVTLLLAGWVATALAFPLLRRGVVRFVDRVVLSRADYGALVDRVAVAVQSAATAEDVLARACEALASALNATSVEWEPHDLQPRAGLDAGSIAVWTAEAPHYLLRIGRLAGGRRLLSGDLAVAERVAAIVARRIDALRLTEERYERRLHEQEMVSLATEAELRALRAQVNPHFLFNTLTTLGYLIQHAPPRALATLMRLTTLLRGVLRSDGEFTTLGRERELIACYLDIERERFEERLQTTIDIPDALCSLPVPALIVQPLVENAVKHGIAKAVAGGRVSVTARLDTRPPAPVLLVEVTNTGAPLGSGHSEDSNGVGLQLVERRLQACYGGAGSVTLARNEPAGTTVATLRLPTSPALRARLHSADGESLAS